ncbi:MAG: hypothetical protein WC604_01610 [Candidatus Gracilibacteria bacterium]
MIKKALVSAWISVLAGMFLFAISTAFGVQVPSDVPPAGLVTPTFSGIEVGTAWAKLQMVNVLDVKGNITNSIPFTAVTVNDAMEVVDKLIVDGATELYSGLGVVGDTLLNGGVIIAGEISRTGNDPVTINDDLTVFQQLDVTSDTSLGGNVGIAADKILTVDNIETNSGHLNVDFNSPVKFNDGATFTIVPSFPAGEIVQFSKIDVLTEIANPNLGMSFVKINDLQGLYVTGPIQLDGNISNYNLNTVEINDGLKVVGAATAKSFGTYTFRESVYGTLSGTGTGTGFKLFSCNVGEQAVSCYGNAYSSVPTVGDFYSGQTYDVYMTGLYPYYGWCMVNYKNASASTRYIKAGALCYNPGI